MYRNISKIQRQTRIRKKLNNVSDRPRLSVHKSNKYCYVQIIDNEGNALMGLSEKIVKAKQQLTSLESAKQLGLSIAKLAQEKKIKVVAFDKGRFAYQGKVKAIAEGAREGGLQF